MAGVGFILLSRIHSVLALFLVYILVVSLGYNAGFFHPTSTAINSWFIRRRGTALGILSAAGSFGGVFMPPLMSYLVLSFDWRTAALSAGAIILIVALPAALVIQRSPEVRGLLPDGDSGQRKGAAQVLPTAYAPKEQDFTVKEALRTLSYWLLTSGITLRMLVTVALTAHFIPILVWKGMSEATAAYLVSLSALLTVAAMLVMGWIGDRWSKPYLCSLGLLATVASLMWLTISASGVALYFFAIALAITMGTTSLNWALIGDFFGRRRYATLRGIMAMVFGVATFFSPIYAGWLFDRTGNYDIVLVSFSILLFLGSSLFATLRRPVLRRGKEASAL